MSKFALRSEFCHYTVVTAKLRRYTSPKNRRSLRRWRSLSVCRRSLKEFLNLQTMLQIWYKILCLLLKMGLIYMKSCLGAEMTQITEIVNTDTTCHDTSSKNRRSLGGRRSLAVATVHRNISPWNLAFFVGHQLEFFPAA